MNKNTMHLELKDKNQHSSNYCVNFFNTKYGISESSSPDIQEVTTSQQSQQTNNSLVPATNKIDNDKHYIKKNEKKFVSDRFAQNLPCNQDSDDDEPRDDLNKEKTLKEFGFNRNEVRGWENIFQPNKTNLLDIMYDMIRKYEYTNVQIRIDKTTFCCHMMVLQCYSDFFKNLTDQQIVILPSDKVTPQAFLMIYEWMLAPRPLIQREGILELFNAAMFLRIKELCDQCWACLDDGEHICEDSAFMLYMEAREYNHELIKDLMLNRIGKFFLTMVATQEFLDLSAEEICAILEKNTIGVHSEAEILMAAVRWLNYDWEERKKYTLEIVKRVRFGLMLPWQLLEFRRNADAVELERVVDHAQVQKMIDDGFSYVTARYWYSSEEESAAAMERLKLQPPNERLWIKDDAFKQKFECPHQYCITYCSFLDYLKTIKSEGKDYWRSFEYFDKNPNLALQKYHKDLNYDERKDQFTQVSLITPLNKEKCSESDKQQNKYVEGDKNNQNKIENQEKTVKDLLKNFSKYSIPELRDCSEHKILLFGGIDPNLIQSCDSVMCGKEVLSYNFTKNNWVLISSMPGTRHYHSAVVCGMKIYVIGGTRPALSYIKQSSSKSTHSVSKTVWSFDYTNLEWTSETNLPHGRRDFGVVATKTGLYVIGGENNLRNPLSSMIYYDTKNRQWLNKPSLQIPRSGLSCILIGQQIWVAGGLVNLQNKTSVTDIIESFDLRTEQWTEIGTLRIPRCFAKMAVINTTDLYIIGGLTLAANNEFLSLSSLDRFCFIKKIWKNVASMSIARHGHDIACINDKIFIFGGVNITKTSKSTLTSVECFSCDERKWIKGMHKLPIPLSGFSAVSV